MRKWPRWDAALRGKRSVWIRWATCVAAGPQGNGRKRRAISNCGGIRDEKMEASVM